MRLVEQPEGRPTSSEHRKRRAPALPGRQPAHGRRGEASDKPEALQRRSAGRLVTARRADGEADVVCDAQIVVQASRLTEQPDLAAHGTSVPDQVVPEHLDVPAHHRLDAGAHPQQRRLACTVGSLQKGYLTGRDIEVSARQGGERPEQRHGRPEVDRITAGHRARVPATSQVHHAGKLGRGRHGRALLLERGQPGPAGDATASHEAAGTVAGMDLRALLRGLGKTFISVGILILLFVAYQLWGTGIAEARDQARLRHQFDAQVGTLSPATTEPPPASSTVDSPVVTTPAATTPSTTTPPTTTAPLPPPPTGSALALLKIPKIGVNTAVVEGVGVGDLKEGPGHYPNSPMPGQAGNAAIAGHRTTYGAPFYRLDELKAGDDIFLLTRGAATPWRYQVMNSHDVSPSDVSVLDPSADNRLTLTTCTPRFSASKRLVVVARLVGAVDPRPPAKPAIGGTPAGEGSSADVHASAPARRVGSLSGQSTSDVPALAWAAVCVLIWLGAWAVGRRRRRWVVYAIATPVFLVCLFFFFENFARFVPANI